MTYKNLCKPSLLVLLVFVLCGWVLPASASERLCDASFEDCRAPLIQLIQNENVEIDVAFWFMDDPVIANALTRKIQAGVKVRMLVDPRSEDAHSGNTFILQQFGTLNPAPYPPPPMRKRIASSILHWKMMLFAGQGVVEFSGANFSQSEMVPAKPYLTYVDEAIFYTDYAAIVNSFRTMYDNWWIDTVNFADYANSAGTLTRSYGIYPIETEACAAVPNGCGIDFLPSSNSKDDYGLKTIAAMRAETTKLDIDMFRITNADITNTTIAAFNRIPVRLIVDMSEYLNPNRVWVRYNVDRMFMAGVPIKITKHNGQNHEKAVLLYGQGLTIWGSSNWSAGSFNYGQEHDYFSSSSLTQTQCPGMCHPQGWFFQWFQNQFERRWNSPQEYKAFVPIGPASPISKTPANGATGQSQSLTLTWDGGAWGQMFDVYLGVGATSTPVLIASNVVTGVPDPPPNHRLASFKLSGLAPNMTYRWRIIGKTMANLTASSPLWSFTTGGTGPTAGATVSSVTPNSGPSTGGTAVTISGTNFAPGAIVSFGFATASKIVVVNNTTITATTPPQVAGSAKVTVTNTAGDSGSLPGAFTYTAPAVSTLPRLNVIVPNTGSPAGGDAVTISGSNLVKGMTVTIGGTPATVTSSSTVSIQATTPAGTPGGPVDVVVTNPNGQSATLKAVFSYVNPPDPPSLSAISPGSGSSNGGTNVILSGSGFRPGAVVSFGGPPAPIGTGAQATAIAVSNSAITCGSSPIPCIIATTPPGKIGTATDVWVTNINPATGVIDSGSGTSTLSGGYAFLSAPSISAISPSSGTVSGGTQITINGTNFGAGATVMVGNQPATILTETSTVITAQTPSNTAGTAPVVVTNPDNGQSSNTLIYTYQ